MTCRIANKCFVMNLKYKLQYMVKTKNVAGTY